MSRSAAARIGAVLALLLGVAESTRGTGGVAPGAVVRWPGDSTVTECAAAGVTWFPIEGDCYFPLDLALAEGQLELARERAGARETARVVVGPYPYPEQRLTVEDRMVDLSPDDLARAERERALVDALWSRRAPIRFRLPLQPPLDPLPEGVNFGARRVFNDQPRSPHSGCDYRARAGTPVLAAAEGTVALADELFFSGRSVFLDHGGGLITMYFHLDEIRVRQGEQVDRGALVGTVGSTGRATGPHLHFGARWLGARVDPGMLLAPPSTLPAP